MQFFKQTVLFFIVFANFAYTDILDSPKVWQRVYLATYPRSGSHWIRGLIEEATHIATSSVYRDKEPMHLKIAFPWGGFAPKGGYEGNCRYADFGEIVVIKTHFPAKSKKTFDCQPAIKVIRIVRHPVDAFYSHFLHQKNKLPNDGKIPRWYVKKSVKKWQKFESYWNQQPNVLTLRYEDLLGNIHFYLREILNNIGYQFSEEDINRAVNKFPPQGSTLKHLQDYHEEELMYISKKLGLLMEKYDYRI